MPQDPFEDDSNLDEDNDEYYFNIGSKTLAITLICLITFLILVLLCMVCLKTFLKQWLYKPSRSDFHQVPSQIAEDSFKKSKTLHK
jgi:hypothetical protein